MESRGVESVCFIYTKKGEGGEILLIGESGRESGEGASDIANEPVSYYSKPMPSHPAIESRLATWLRYGIYLTALLPLIIFKDFLSPFHFGKVILFRAWMEILLVGYVALIMTDRCWLPRRDTIFGALTIFTAVFGLATLTS